METGQTRVSGSAEKQQKQGFYPQSARQRWWRGSYFGSLTLWKGVLWSTLSAPLPLRRLPPCAHVGERLKPERRWCHGPDVKKARWPLAPLLRPPSSSSSRSSRSSTHPAKTGGAHAVLEGRPPPHAEQMENGVEKWAMMRRNWGDITAANGGGNEGAVGRYSAPKQWRLWFEFFSLTNVMFLHLRINQNVSGMWPIQAPPPAWR